MNLANLLDERAADQPTASALIDKHRSLSFADLSSTTKRGAAGLHMMGLSPGDVVLVMMSMRAKLYEVVLSVLRAGLVAAFVDPGAGKTHVEQFC